MAWYDRLLGRELEVEEKLNPSQQYYDHQTAPSREFTLKYEKAYEDIAVSYTHLTLPTNREV